MPVAPDLAELLRQELGLRREHVKLSRRNRDAMHTKRHDPFAMRVRYSTTAAHRVTRGGSRPRRDGNIRRAHPLIKG